MGRGGPPGRMMGATTGLPKKRLKLAGLTRVKESECLCAVQHSLSFSYGSACGPCLPAA